MITRKLRIFFHAIGMVAILFITMFSNVTHSTAQQAFFWSSQKRIPDYYDSTEEPPYLIADMDHTVHAFNSQPLDLDDSASPKAVFYRQWTKENGWTFPNDILFDDGGGNTDLVSVTSDQTGVVHLVFQRNNRNLFYTYAYLALAEDPAAWAIPNLITDHSSAIRPGVANIGAIAVDGNGNDIVVIYSGSEYGNGLYYVASFDKGKNWSTPYPIYLAEEVDMIVTDPEIYFGQSGFFHAVWSTFKSDGSGGPGYYVRLDPNEQTWSDAIDLDISGIRTPSVIEYQDDVIVSYHHFSSNGNWWRRSSDGGQSWSPPSQVSPRFVGTNGGLTFTIDSNDTLHAFFGERIDDNNHGMWHIIWTGNSWTNPEAVVRGSQVKDLTGGKGFDPRSARAVVINGNIILVTWGTDGAAGLNGAWYSYKVLDTPELPSQPLPLPSVGIGNDSIPTPSKMPTTRSAITPTIEVDLSDTNPGVRWSPQFAIFVGVIPAILLLIVFIVIRYISRYRRL